MNNALLIEEPEKPVDNTVYFRERRTTLLKLVKSINELAKSEDWNTLKELLFDGLVEKLEKSLKIEAEKDELQLKEIYRLQGQLIWARRYSDIYKLAETYKLEINNLNKKLNENA